MIIMGCPGGKISMAAVSAKRSMCDRIRCVMVNIYRRGNLVIPIMQKCAPSLYSLCAILDITPISWLDW